MLGFVHAASHGFVADANLRLASKHVEAGGAQSAQVAQIENPSAAAASLREIIALCGADQLEDVSRQVGACWVNGEITDDEAGYLWSVISNRRPSCRDAKPLAKSVGRRFLLRRRRGSPDRKASRDRRRMLGGSGAMPDTLRHHYTEGQRAVLCIVAGEVKRQGICDLPIDKIAALAGVCRTTVQTSLQDARRLGHAKITERPRRGQKSLTNVVEIISPEWRAWMRRGQSAARNLDRVKFTKMVNPTKNIDIKNGLAKRTMDRARKQWPEKTAEGREALAKRHLAKLKELSDLMKEEMRSERTPDRERKPGLPPITYQSTARALLQPYARPIAVLVDKDHAGGFEGSANCKNVVGHAVRWALAGLHASKGGN